MLQQLHKKRGGFTLVEIMIVVAIIALLASIAVPNFLRARLRSQSTTILQDLRLIDSAIEQYIIENNATGNITVTWAMVSPYLKAGSRLAVSNGTDIFGNSFSLPTGGAAAGTLNVPGIAPATFNALSDVSPAAFWSPYTTD
jgi:prepilin-type N-terminal cleavage/methylation domain-containing protein